MKFSLTFASNATIKRTSAHVQNLYKIIVTSFADTHWKPVAKSLANTPIGNTIGSMLECFLVIFRLKMH